MRWTPEVLLTRAFFGGRKRRVVLAPRRWCQAGGSNSYGDGGQKARRTRESAPCEAAGASSARHSPRPLFEGCEINEYLAQKKHAARSRKYASTSLRAKRSNPSLHLRRHGLLRFARSNDGFGRHPACHHPRKRVIQYSRDS